MTKAVLIVKGDLSALELLDILDLLLAKVRHEVGQTSLEPHQLFSFICASGPIGALAILLGRLQKSTSECRKLVEKLVENTHTHRLWLHEVSSSWLGWSSFKQAQSCLERCIGTPTPFQNAEHACKVFIWKAHGIGQSPDHLTSYQYHEEKSTVTTFEAARECMRLRERASIEYPLKGMVQEVMMRHGELHSGQVYISIIAPAAGMGEVISDQEAGKKLDQIATGSDKAHFSFVIDRQGISKCVSSWPIDEAVSKLADVFLNRVA